MPLNRGNKVARSDCGVVIAPTKDLVYSHGVQNTDRSLLGSGTRRGVV